MRKKESMRKKEKTSPWATVHVSLSPPSKCNTSAKKICWLYPLVVFLPCSVVVVAFVVSLVTTLGGSLAVFLFLFFSSESLAVLMFGPMSILLLVVSF